MKMKPALLLSAALCGLLAWLLSLSQQSAALAAGADWERTPVWATLTALAKNVAASAQIRLTASGAPATAWTVVQWQDAHGQWQTVAGWQGTLDADGGKTWQVAENVLGAGPFRWVVYAKREGQVWATSPSFHLPSQAGLTVAVTTQPAAKTAGSTVSVVPAAHDGLGLILTTSNAPAMAWTAVQWQDARGQWQPVAGWQGALDTAGQKSWQAEPDLANAGPFRWVIYTQPGGAVWSTSPAFNLPAAERQDVIVQVVKTP